MADLSSYPKPTAPQNPLAVYSQLLQAQGLQNQNQLFQTEFADRRALNQAYQAATDPQTGAVDMGRLAAALAGGGMGRLLPQAQQGIQEFQKRALELDKAQLEVGQQRISAMSNALSSLLANPNPTRQDVIQKASQLIAQKVITPQAAAAFLADVPTEGPQLKAKLNELMISTLASQERLAALTPRVNMVDVGAAVLPMDVNPITNPGITSQPIPKSLSPEAATAPTPVLVRNPDGSFSPSSVTRQQFSNMANQGPVATAPPLTAGGLSPAEAAAPRTINIDGQEYQVPTAVWMQLQRGMGATQARGGAAQTGMAPGIGLPSGPPPGRITGANVSAEAASKAANEAYDFAATAPQRLFQLEQAETALANPNVDTGPGSETVNTIKSFLLNYGGSKFGDVENTVKDYESARKYLTQYATGQAGNLGQGTDAKLAAAFTGNPNTSLSKLAAQDLIKSAIGLERMQQSVALAWNQSGEAPENFNKWRVGFVKDLDPRVFVIDKLPEDKREKLRQSVAKMSRPEQEKFAKSYNLAVSAGIIPNLYGGP